MKGIVPHLWFDTEAQEAAVFYTRLFDNSKITTTQTLEDTPSGDATSVEFELAGQPLMAINAGPFFKLNPSISLTVLCSSKEEIDNLWHALSISGEILMPLEEYPFSEYYGWIQDRFGLSWQLILADDTPITQKIIPHFLFSNEAAGKAGEAMAFYTEVFPKSAIDDTYYYELEEAENPNSKVIFAAFHLDDMPFQAMDDANEAAFSFNEAFSLMILCENQEEVDYYWDKLSADPEAEQCGWLKDKYGVSWQVIPEKMNELLANGTRDQINNVTQSFLQMKKLDIAELEKVWKEAK